MGRFFNRERTTGFPTSSNRASSMHLWWDPSPAPAQRIAVTLTVADPPTVPHLYFWALQVNFADPSGRRLGGAHLGLQWHRGHPGSTAVNWGGYRDGAGELDGEESLLPSAMNNVNTRDYPWRPNVAYRLEVAGTGDGWWTGSVTDVSSGDKTVVRDLFGGGTQLVSPGVWSEVFARCDDPSVIVEWSDFDPPTPSMRTTYQERAAGGCDNTASVDLGDRWAQITNAPRQ